MIFCISLEFAIESSCTKHFQKDFKPLLFISITCQMTVDHIAKSRKSTEGVVDIAVIKEQAV